MKEKANRPLISSEAKQARAIDLIDKLGFDADTYDPRNAGRVRFQDLLTKIISYQKQLSEIKDPEGEKIVHGRVTEIIGQMSSGFISKKKFENFMRGMGLID